MAVRHIRYLAAGASLALVLAAFASARAQSLLTGQCYDATAVRASLAGMGQHTILLGQRSGSGHPTTLAFTSNDDGSLGYLVRGDRTLGEPATTICVDSVYRDVRLNDTAKPGIPDWARVSVDEARVTDFCRSQKIGYQGECKSQTRSLTNQESNGQRVLFAAKGTAINPQDDTIRGEQLLSVTYSDNNKGGLIEATTSFGAAYMIWGYAHVTLSEFTAPLRARTAH